MFFCPYYLRTVLSVATLCESAKASLLVLCLYHGIKSLQQIVLVTFPKTIIKWNGGL